MDHGNSTTATNNNSNSNPYLQLSPLPANGRGPQGRRPMDKIFDSLNRFGKRFEDATRKAESHAGSIWHHLKTSSSVSDAAMARLAQGTKVLTEGGHDKLFQQSFGIITGEKLLKTFACYLSTATGPVIGTLYISTKRIAFYSDNPIYQILPTGQPQWMYYKVVVPLDQLGAVSPSSDRLNHSAKYINIATRDGHEFWFMGFISYEKALKHLTEALQHSHDSYLSIPDSYLSIPVN